MCNWIINFITASQLKYPSIFKTPTDVLTHLLFSNGNGHEVEDGNFVMDVTGYGSSVEYSIIYAHQRDTEALIEHINEYDSDGEIHQSFESIMKYSDVSESDKVYEKCCNAFFQRYDKTIWVDDFNIEQLKDVSVLKELILQNKYAPYLGLSPKYYKAYDFNNNTNKDMIGVTIALANAYVDVLLEFLDGKHSDKKNPFGAGPIDIGKLAKEYKNDIAQLKQLLSRLRGLS